jgi:hypothetical protein
LPGRYPSVLDWALNTGGGAVGAALGLVLHQLRVLKGWDRLRDRWFDQRSAGALALLALWPVALLFPSPFPLGLGWGWQRVQSAGVDWLLDVPWAQRALEWWLALSLPTHALPRWLEGVGVVLGWLGPCLLAFAVMSPGVRRLLLACLLGLAGGLALTASAALNFGPQHALAWLRPVVVPAGLTAFGLVFLLSAVSARLALVLGIAALAGLAGLVAVAPVDAYFAQSLQAWEQGRFVRFHGLAQWLGWLWPWVALAWLLSRLRGRPQPAAGALVPAAYNPGP